MCIANKGFFTNAACVRPLSCVYSHVDAQVTRLCEALRALCAPEGALSRMIAQVFRDLALGQERLGAFRAAVRPLSRVGPVVSVQRGRSEEQLPAELAGNARSCRMRHQMAIESVMRFKAIVALRASVRSFRFVGHRVPLQADVAAEALPTLLTEERLVTGMNLCMYSECTALLEAFRATRTLIRPLLVMRLHVFNYRLEVYVSFRTLGTLVGSFEVMDIEVVLPQRVKPLESLRAQSAGKLALLLMRQLVPR